MILVDISQKIFQLLSEKSKGCVYYVSSRACLLLLAFVILSCDYFQREKGKDRKGRKGEKGKGCMVDCLRRSSMQVTVKSSSLFAKSEYELSGSGKVQKINCLTFEVDIHCLTR